ncbi:MAG: Fur family transcriptional regulator, partial [Mycoplasmatales bacterium]
MQIDDIKTDLKNNGYRFTKAREEMINIFLEKPETHFTIEQILDELHKLGENNVATTYNNINAFVELKILREFTFNHKK